jgi:hypothetical protein
MKIDKVKRMRFIDAVCWRCKILRVYYEDFQGSRAAFLEAEGWRKIKGCWVCDECAAEEEL